MIIIMVTMMIVADSNDHNAIKQPKSTNTEC